MVALKILFVIAVFAVGYFVGANNPTKSVIQKIKDKL